MPTPTPTTNKDTGLHASALTGLVGGGTAPKAWPQPPLEFPLLSSWSFCFRGFDEQTKVRADVFIATTNFRLGLEPLTKFSLQGSFQGGASQARSEGKRERGRVSKEVQG